MSFVWRDAGRVVLLAESSLQTAPRLLAEQGVEAFELISTRRALGGAEALAEAAADVHELSAAPVPEAAAALLDRVHGPRLVALGGGRVIDSAKAIASVTGARVAAIPTTMSGAEMTGIHRLPAGAEGWVRELHRPDLVLAYPELMTSQPQPSLRASSMNALAHGADSLYTPFANPVSGMTALRGAALIAMALDQEPRERDRAALALGSLLCGYAIDSAMFSLHHVACQTLVRICGTPHAETNAAILPRAMAFMAPRAPDGLAPFAAAIGSEPAEVDRRLLELGGNPKGLGELGAERAKLEPVLDAMLQRPELDFSPRPPTREELRKLIEAAW